MNATLIDKAWNFYHKAHDAGSDGGKAVTVAEAKKMLGVFKKNGSVEVAGIVEAERMTAKLEGETGNASGVNAYAKNFLNKYDPRTPAERTLAQTLGAASGVAQATDKLKKEIDTKNPSAAEKKAMAALDAAFQQEIDDNGWGGDPAQGGYYAVYASASDHTVVGYLLDGDYNVDPDDSYAGYGSLSVGVSLTGKAVYVASEFEGL
jgi:hypothetical protein